MYKSIKITLLVLCLIFWRIECKAQVKTKNDSLDYTIQTHIEQTSVLKRNELGITEKTVLEIVDALPAFGVFKDSYFITGIPLNGAINSETADALFHISIRQRITKSRLPFNTFLYLTYSQKSFWNIYAESSPFRDNNYNPALGFGKYIIHNNKFKGTVFIQFEHESNGKDSIDSRSWNMISFSTKYFYNLRLILGAKAWIPIVDGKENRDLIDYKGIATFSVNYITKDTRWWFSAEINPRKGFGNINTTLTAAVKVSGKSNQYLYARFFDGRGESLLDYKKYNINIRVGFCIKPDFGSIF